MNTKPILLSPSGNRQTEAPSAYPRQPPTGLTALQTHVAFFDMNGDGYVTPKEVAQGFKDLGMPGPTRLWLPLATGILKTQADLINKRAAEKQLPGYQPIRDNVIPIKDIGIGKHDSDTDAYEDDRGGFDQAKFDAMFAKADKNNSGALDLAEILTAAWGRKESVQGLVASVGEFGLLWALGSDVREQRLGGWLPSRSAVSRHRLSETLKGKGFYEIASEQAARRKK